MRHGRGRVVLFERRRASTGKASKRRALLRGVRARLDQALSVSRVEFDSVQGTRL